MHKVPGDWRFRKKIVRALIAHDNYLDTQKMSPFFLFKNISLYKYSLIKYILYDQTKTHTQYKYS